MPSVGIDISDDAIRYVEIVEDGGVFQVRRFGAEPLPAGAVESGHINDHKTITEKLRAIRDKYRFKFVRASLPEEKGYLFKLELPITDPHELADAVPFKIEENAPVHASEAIFDYEVVAVGKGVSTLAVNVFPEPVISNYLEVFHAAGLVPLSFEPEGFAVKRSVVAHGDLGAHLIVNLEENETGLTVVAGGFVRFTSTLQLGGSRVTDAFAKLLGVGRAEAFESKMDKGLVEINLKKDEMEDAMLALSSIKDEVNRVIVYWQTHERSQSIDTILLCGHDALLKGLDRYLSVSLKKKVKVANVWENVYDFNRAIPPIDRAQSLSFAAAIGLALPNNEI